MGTLYCIQRLGEGRSLENKESIMMGPRVKKIEETPEQKKANRDKFLAGFKLEDIKSYRAQPEADKKAAK